MVEVVTKDELEREMGSLKGRMEEYTDREVARKQEMDRISECKECGNIFKDSVHHANQKFCPVCKKMVSYR